MSSTKLTTSANALRIGLAVAVGALAAVAMVGAGRDALGERALERGQAVLAQAASLPRGAERDSVLADVLTIADRGVDMSPHNAGLWNLLGEAQLLQATTAALGTVSPDLLVAAANSSTQAARLAPADAAAPARIAFVRSLQTDGRSAVGAALAQSYSASAFDRALSLRRLEAAGRAWPELSEKVRADALLEACQLARQGKAERDALYDVRMGDADPAMALALDRIMADESCAVRG